MFRPHAFVSTEQRPSGRMGAALVVILAGSFGCGTDAPVPDPSADPRGQQVAQPEAPADTALPQGAQTRSLLGEVFFPPPLSEELREEREANLVAALEERDEYPDDPEAWIWVGRHQAYLGEYRAAIATFTEGWERFPDDARFLRHRGHRQITLRDFPAARDDLALGIEIAGEAMAEIEADGLPNALGIPLTTLGFNLWYHRALAEYLEGDFEAARSSWIETLEVSDNADLQVAARYWLHLTTRRMGDEAAAAEAIEGIDESTEVIENGAYRDLILLLRGDRTVDEVLGGADDGLAGVTTLYGVAMHELLSGELDSGRARLQRILDQPEQWPAFGYVAAEAEVAAGRW